jgi:hypothetical protein
MSRFRRRGDIADSDRSIALDRKSHGPYKPRDMKTLVEIGTALLAALVVVGPAGAQPAGAQPAAAQPAGAPLPFSPLAPAPLPSSLTNRSANRDEGRVLLLENDRLLEGEIERIGNRYRIRRPVGELWIPCDRARRLCRDLDEAFFLMQAQANLRDPDERLRLARWCRTNGLRDRALSEARAALDMRPDHMETIQFVQILQRLSIGTTQAPKTAASGSSRPAAAPVQATVAAAPSLDISDDVFVTFSARVQPILINACYSCHHQGKSTAFLLSRPNEGSYRTSAQRNLAAVLEHVNVEKTILSPLLIKSVVAHGGATQSPLHGRQSVPFQTMQAWVEQLVANNPHLVEIRRASAATTPAFGATTSAKHDYGEETGPASFSSEPSVSSRQRIPVPPPSMPPLMPPLMPPAMPSLGPTSQTPPAGFPSQPSAPVVSAPPRPRDPFDADEFNRQNDPKK